MKKYTKPARPVVLKAPNVGSLFLIRTQINLIGHFYRWYAELVEMLSELTCFSTIHLDNEIHLH